MSQSLLFSRSSLHMRADYKKQGFPNRHNSKLQSTSDKGTELSISVWGTAVSAQFGLAKGSSGESTRQSSRQDVRLGKRRNVRSVSSSVRREEHGSRGRRSTPPWLMSGLPGWWKLWPFEQQRAFSASDSHPGPPWAGNPDWIAVSVILWDTEHQTNPL